MVIAEGGYFECAHYAVNSELRVNAMTANSVNYAVNSVNSVVNAMNSEANVNAVNSKSPARPPTPPHPLNIPQRAS